MYFDAILFIHTLLHEVYSFNFLYVLWRNPTQIHFFEVLPGFERPLRVDYFEVLNFPTETGLLWLN